MTKIYSNQIKLSTIWNGEGSVLMDGVGNHVITLSANYLRADIKCNQRFWKIQIYLFTQKSVTMKLHTLMQEKIFPRID